MDRRRLTCSCALGLASLFAPLCSSAFTSKAVGENEAGPSSRARGPQTGSVSRSFIGCYLLGAGGGTGAPGFRLSSTTGVPALDAGITNEYPLLNHNFGVVPGFFMFDDAGGGNAFATPQNIGGHSAPHGTVCFGLRLMNEELLTGMQAGGRGDHVMVAIMAHEWAHILQFRRLPQMRPGKAPELMADALAGWYMASRASSVYGGVDVGSSMRSFFNKGDLNFNSPHHHGTPPERANAFRQGLSMGGADAAQAFETARRTYGL